MIVSDLLNIEDVTLVNQTSSLQKPIDDVYISDLLSWVMGHVRKENVCFLTILNSVNIIAVASLLEMSVVVFCENVTPSNEVIEKANQEGIQLLKTKKSTAHLAKDIYSYESLL